MGLGFAAGKSKKRKESTKATEFRSELWKESKKAKM